MSLHISTIRRAWNGLDNGSKPVWVTVNATGVCMIRVGNVRQGTTCELAGYFTNKVALHDFADAVDAAADLFEAQPGRAAA